MRLTLNIATSDDIFAYIQNQEGDDLARSSIHDRSMIGRLLKTKRSQVIGRAPHIIPSRRSTRRNVPTNLAPWIPGVALWRGVRERESRPHLTRNEREEEDFGVEKFLTGVPPGGLMNFSITVHSPPRAVPKLSSSLIRR